MPRVYAASGLRDCRIEIQTMADATADSGFPTESATTLRHVWASKDDRDGTERYSGAQWTAQRLVIWIIPYAADMDPDVHDIPKTRRVLYSGRSYDIRSAVMIGRREQIRLVTEVRVG